MFMSIDLAAELNNILEQNSNSLFKMLSPLGKKLYFPKGIITQSIEAKRFGKDDLNATVGIAKENMLPMHLQCVERFFVEDLNANEIFSYAPTSGVKELRDVWKERQNSENKSAKHSTSPVVTGGITHGLSIVGDVFFDDETLVIIPDMHWGNYRLIWGVGCNSKIIHYPLFKEDLSGFNIGAFEEALLQGVNYKKTVVVLNFPNNPSGYSLREEEAEEILNVLKCYSEKGYSLITICDDAYSGLCYEKGIRKESLFGDISNLSDNIISIKVDGCTKEYFMWGFRIGFITIATKYFSKLAYEAIETKLSAALRRSVSNICNVSQSVLLRSLKDKIIEKQREEKFSLLKSRYGCMKDLVSRENTKKFWDVYPCNSGYFICLRLKKIFNAEKIRRIVLENNGIGVISLPNNSIRIAFSCIEEGSMENFINKLISCLMALKQ
jgi:aspartate/methionine/tyrosine aminotransferase